MGEVRLLPDDDVRLDEVTRWAADRLRDVLTARGVRVGDGPGVASDDVGIALRLAGAQDGADGETPREPESFGLDRAADGTLTVTGADPRGLLYGVLELADAAEHADDPVAALRDVRPGTHAPATRVRGVLRTLTSDVQDLSWFHDREFWDEYLTHLATHRINRFHLALGMQYNYSHDPDVQDNYLAFAYPFLVAPEGFDVRARGVDDAERDRNLESLRYIAQAAHRRGLHFQLGLWNHAYAFPESPRERYPVEGLTPQTHAEYCRAALREVLTACPDIDGVTVRVHYEGGVHEPTHEFWSVVLQGLSDVGRPIELDMHSKGVDARILDAARARAGRFVVSAKYWAEHLGLPYHQAAVREMEYAKPEREGLSGVTRGARRFTRYGYGDFLRDDRDFDLVFRVWPGTQRVLLWADPDQVAGIARSTAAIGGAGVELCEPLSFLGRKTTGTYGGRQPYVGSDLRTPGDPWTKYARTYRLWGRLLYDPDPDDRAGTARDLDRTYGAAGRDVGAALSAASKVLPLVTTYHSPSASNNFYWPEMYVNMPLARSGRSAHYAFDTPEPGTVGAVSPFDPEMFASIDAFADEVVEGRRSGKYTPLEVAQWLDGLAECADQHLAAATARAADGDAQFRRASLDITVQSRLATFYAEKTRAGLAYALHLRTRSAAHLHDAVGHYTRARDAFAAVVDLTTGTYAPDLAFGDRISERGHWADRLPAIEDDLAELREELAQLPDSGHDDRTLPAVPTRRPQVAVDVPADYVRGEAVRVRVTVPADLDCRVDLHYRHLNQGEEWTTAPTSAAGRTHTGTVPEEYTQSVYPLELYVTVHGAHGDAWIVPGFDEILSNQPYLVLRAEGRPA